MQPGRLWQIDSNGIIQNDAHHEAIQPPYAALVNAAVQSYVDHIGNDLDSIYVTGSVARGMTVAGESDLNMVAVTGENIDPDLVLQDWIEPAERAIEANHSVVRRVELEIWPYHYVFTDPTRFSIGAFILKTNSVCRWGSDLALSLPDYKITPGIANDDLVQIAEDVAAAQTAISADPGANNVRNWSRSIAKSLLWAGFGLVQMQTGVHTRDVDMCYRYFAQHYPGHAADLRRMLDYVTTPTDDVQTLQADLERCGGWLIAQADKWLDQYNPARDLALLIDDVEAIE